MSADAMDIAGNRIGDFCSEESYQRITDDVCDILIKTSGSPEYWDELPSYTGVSPGLADTKNSSGANKLNSKKLKSLQNNPELMDKIIPEGFKCSVTIYSTDPSVPALCIVNQTPNFNTQVYVANRTVVYCYDTYFVFSTLNIDQNLDFNSSHYNCPHSQIEHNIHKFPDFKNNNPGWVCDVFKVGQDNLNSTDFYLITDPPHLMDKQAVWMIDTPDNLTDNAERFVDHPMDITQKIRDNWKTGALIIHVYTSTEYTKPFKLYIVGVPSGTPLSDVKVNYLGLKSGYFILKIWN